eukprot:TRINITY_DN63478_c0_g1_i1.p1 TRINITY_DN63478_c0_g1~~TRINITY_DN63478_c0_g1_i1.p1  ORF type:complete len:1052 (-),score=280.09 TRINITY_DN63478_c0_g1_i1:39-3194(-)
MTGYVAPMVQPSAADLAKELQQRVTMFHAGDELYSGAWLADFQKTGGTAWQVCTEALRMGPLPTCDQELLQAFCAQTLARLARAFVTWFPDVATQKAARDGLEALLALHSQGQTLVWKHLALSLACAEIWLGTWAAAAVITAGALPAAVRRELLLLPAELLFDEKALPLTDRQLREAAAASLFRSCDDVFAFLLQGLAEEFVPQEDKREALRVLSAWLRAVRKSQLWQPGNDAAAPLRCLALQGLSPQLTMSEEELLLSPLLAAARAAPAEAAEVAQQLAKWRGAPQAAAEILQPLLGCIFAAARDDMEQESPTWLLPLLDDLAKDLWPRATVGDVGMDWQPIAEQAFLALGWSASAWKAGEYGELGAVEDAEVAIAVWQTFAETLQSALRAAESFGCSSALTGSTDPAPLLVPPPEKRLRRNQERWQLSRAKLEEAGALQQLFQLLAEKFLEYLRLPIFTDHEEAMESCQTARAAAESALLPWAAIVSKGARSSEFWAPLQNVEAQLRGVCEGAADGNAYFDGIVAEDVEVVLWFFGAICGSLPEDSGVSIALPQLAGLDTAPAPWRALLWSAACKLATAINTSQALSSEENGPVMLEWMLERPPSKAGEPCMLEVTELPYAQALEAACKRLPAGAAQPAVGETLFMLAFASWNPSSTQDERNLEVQAAYLSALRSAMGSAPDMLCQSLSGKVLPGISQAANAEAARSSSSGAWDSPGTPWPATRLLFETLAAMLPVGHPTSDDSHPAVAVWRQGWHSFEEVLLRHPVDAATDQPLKAAAQALKRAGLHAPTLLVEVLQLLARSAAQRDSAEVQLQVLREIVVGVPCPPVDPTKIAEVLARTIATAAEALLQRSQVLVDSPDELAAFFGLLAEAVRPSPPGAAGVGPCEDRLRPQLIGQRALIGRCLALVADALPDCRSESASRNMLRFVARLMSPEEAEPEAHCAMLAAALSPLCAAVCRALAAQDFLAEPEALAEAGEVFLAAAAALPEQLIPALEAGLAKVELPDHSKALLRQHISARAEWSQKGHWLEQLQQIVVEWKSERHLNVL